MVSHPDEVISHLPDTHCCCSCGQNDWEDLPVEVAQVMDIAPIKAKVTEHHKTGFKCKKCGDVFSGSFLSEKISANRLQYEPNIQSLAVYFNQYHFIPYHRLAEMFSDCFGVDLSVGSLVNFMKWAHVRLLLFEECLREALLSSPVLHSDETGIRCEGKTQWTHTARNDNLTYYHLDEHHGTEAMERIDILPLYKGHLVHDRYASYFGYDQMSHSLCNAHLLRDLKYLHEQEGCD